MSTTSPRAKPGADPVHENRVAARLGVGVLAALHEDPRQPVNGGADVLDFNRRRERCTRLTGALVLHLGVELGELSDVCVEIMVLRPLGAGVFERGAEIGV